MTAELLTTEQTAKLLGLKPTTLEHWRIVRKGPAFVRVGPRCIRYRRSDLEEWVESRVVENKKPLA
jgi:excisionase family DNA binding protein